MKKKKPRRAPSPRPATGKRSPSRTKDVPALPPEKSQSTDSNGRPIRVGAIVCVDGPAYGRVEYVCEAAIVIRKFSFENPFHGPVEGWQAAECTVVAEPEEMPGLPPIANAALALARRIAEIVDEIGFSRSNLMADEQEAERLDEIATPLEDSIVPLMDIVRWNLSGETSKGVTGALADALHYAEHPTEAKPAKARKS